MRAGPVGYDARMSRSRRLLLLPLLFLVAGCPYIGRGAYDARLDLDGDGVLRPDDCDDGDASVGKAAAYYADDDRDGYGDPLWTVEVCPGDPRGVDNADDCDDTRPLVNPAGEERCNAVDDDCDGDIDEDDATDAPTWYPDQDGDGAGEFDAPGFVACDATGAYVSNHDDCDDTNPVVRDVVWFVDRDGDGYGSTDVSALVRSCEAPTGTGEPYSRLSGDCDDAAAHVNPGAAEVCDGADVDEDCDGHADDADEDGDAVGRSRWYADADGDGLGDIHSSVRACDPVDGHADNDLDCDDTVRDAAASADCPFVDVSVGRQARCAVRSNGRLECHGEPWIFTDLPTGGFLSVGVGSEHACAVDVDGLLTCWGENAAVLASLEAESGEDDERYAMVDVDVNQTCALTTDGRIHCWGDGIAYEVTTPAIYVSVDAGTYHACGLTDRGYADCFGSCSDEGECNEPEQKMSQVVAGRGYSCGIIEATQRVTCWGSRGSVAGYFQASLIDAYQENACALTPAGHLVCWGDGADVLEFETYSDLVQLDVGTQAACVLDRWGGLSCEVP